MQVTLYHLSHSAGTVSNLLADEHCGGFISPPGVLVVAQAFGSNEQTRNIFKTICLEQSKLEAKQINIRKLPLRELFQNSLGIVVGHLCHGFTVKIFVLLKHSSFA